MDLNKVMLMGNVTQTPEVKEFSGGGKVVNFSLATNKKYTDKSGTQQNEATFHNLVAWNKTADIVEKYVEKGKKIFVEGEIKVESWTDKDGNNRKTTKINVYNLILLGSNQGGKIDTKKVYKNLEVDVEGMDIDNIPI